MFKLVTKANWNNRAKSIETKNLKQWHRTPYWLSIQRELDKSIIEYADEMVVFEENEYKKIRKYCLSEQYAKN